MSGTIIGHYAPPLAGRRVDSCSGSGKQASFSSRGNPREIYTFLSALEAVAGLVEEPRAKLVGVGSWWLRL